MANANVIPFERPQLNSSEREVRRRVLKGASILRGVAQSEIKCVVRNQHGHGAGLQIDPQSPVPREFLLYIPVDGIAYRCKLSWRKGDRVGVEFLGTEAKPNWLY